MNYKLRKRLSRSVDSAPTVDDNQPTDDTRRGNGADRSSVIEIHIPRRVIKTARAPNVRGADDDDDVERKERHRNMRRRVLMSDDDSDSETLGSRDTDDESSSVESKFDMLTQMERISENPVLHAEYERVTKFLADQVPTVEQILATNTDLRSKAKLLDTFEMYTESLYDSPAVEQMAIRQELAQLYRTACNDARYNTQFTTEQKSTMDAQLTELEAYTEPPIPTRIVQLPLPIQYKKMLYARYQYFQKLSTTDDEHAKLSDWFNIVLSIPWSVPTPTDKIQCVAKLHSLRASLDSSFYGLDTVKQQLMLYVHQRLYFPEMKDHALALVGPPGVGKSSITRILSDALDIPFHQLSGGAITSNDHIYGHSYTYIGSQAGAFVRSIIIMKSVKGIVLIEEFEKLPPECLGALLHVLDPTQNMDFRDRYVGDIPVDLSPLWVILNMNAVPTDPALVNRLFCLHIDDYTFTDKVQILLRYAIPKLLREIRCNMQFTTGAVEAIVRHTEGQTGVRAAIQAAQDVVRKLCFLVENRELVPFPLTSALEAWKPTDDVTAEIVRPLLLVNSTRMTMSMYM